jgi:hypothetical protein
VQSLCVMCCFITEIAKTNHSSHEQRQGRPQCIIDDILHGKSNFEDGSRLWSLYNGIFCWQAGQHRTTVRCSYRRGYEGHEYTGDWHMLHGVSRIVSQDEQGPGKPELYVGSRITLFTFVSSCLTMVSVLLPLALAALCSLYCTHNRLMI